MPTALLASAALSAASALISYRRGSANGRLAPYMLAMALASFAIAHVTSSDRFLLAKESVLTALVGLWFLRSIWAEPPLTYVLTRPLLERKTPVPWETLWARSPRFRRTWRVSTGMWAAATLPIYTVPALQTALMIATMLLMQVVTWVCYWRAGLWATIYGYVPDIDPA